LLYSLGDFAGGLGWRPPIRSTARREIVRGALGDPSAWLRVSGIVPKSLSAALAARPASVQKRWLFRIYLMKPIAFVILSLFWLITGLIALGPGYRGGFELMHEAGESRPTVSRKRKNSSARAGRALSRFRACIRLMARRRRPYRRHAILQRGGNHGGGRSGGERGPGGASPGSDADRWELGGERFG
jgi:hypothetical protein